MPELVQEATHSPGPIGLIELPSEIADLDIVSAAPQDQPIVLIVDDDEGMRLAIAELLETVGIETMAFTSGSELLAAALPNRPACLILDVRMPGISGLDLQTQLAARGAQPPIIFITAHGDVPMTIQAMKAGAIDFLTKPLRHQALLDAVYTAIDADRERRSDGAAADESTMVFERLTHRERQVFAAIASGRLNKQIAYDLGITEVTVKLHRGNLMKKANVTSIAALVKIWDCLPEALQRDAVG